MSCIGLSTVTTGHARRICRMARQLRIAAAMIVVAGIGCGSGDPPQGALAPADPNASSDVETSDSTDADQSDQINAQSASTTVEQAVPVPIEPEIPSRTIWEGVYTEEQRRRGEAVYASACVRCHGEALERDDVVPELAGELFLHRWSRKRAGNLFAFMKSEMPPKAEERLTPAEYVDVLAYIFSQNQAPSGEKELPTSFAALQAIRMTRGD